MHSEKDHGHDSQAFPHSALRKRRSNPLEWLARHKNPQTGQSYLEEAHIHIGESFMQDVLSLRGHYKSQSWSEYIDRNNNHQNNFIDIKLASKKRLYEAMQALGEQQKIVIDLCVKGRNLSEIEKKYGLKKGNAKHILRHGLDCLKYIYK